MDNNFSHFSERNLLIYAFTNMDMRSVLLTFIWSGNV